MEKRIADFVTWTQGGPKPDYGLSSTDAKDCRDDRELYVNLFIHTPEWSKADPNTDETCRWDALVSLLNEQVQTSCLRMIDVGCGRGWLANLAGRFGVCHGVEPVAEVVKAGRRLFPDLSLTVGTGSTILNSPDFSPYDAVFCSEVIEHVPYTEQPGFLSELWMLLKPGGFF